MGLRYVEGLAFVAVLLVVLRLACWRLSARVLSSLIMQFATPGKPCTDQSCPRNSMFVEPGATSPKPTAKEDPTAFARSSIRRQRAVRYSPHVRDHQSTLNSLLSSNQSRPQGRMRMLADRRSLLEEIRRQDRTAEPTASSPNDTQDFEAEADLAHSEASQRSRLESGRALLRDALSYERPGRRMRFAREDALSGTPRPRAMRDIGSPLSSSDVEGLRTLSRSESTRSPPPGYMPTPPYTSGDTSNRSSSYIAVPPLSTASLTPGFAPAHRLDRRDEIRANLEREEVLTRLSRRMGEMNDVGEREYVAGHRAEINRMRSQNPTELTLEYREAEAAYLESVETRLDLMRRMRERDLSELPHSHRMDRPFQDPVRATPGHSQDSLDGLGDRERSFSPDEDQWQTMLTTIQPDERVPSQHSSFTSASASFSSLSSNPVSSYGTIVTAPSSTTDVEACPAEFDDSDDDLIGRADAQISQAENQARRIQSLSHRLNHQQTHNEQQARHRRMLDREDELQRLEASLRRLEQQIAEEQPVTAEQRSRAGARTGRERL